MNIKVILSIFYNWDKIITTISFWDNPIINATLLYLLLCVVIYIATYILKIIVYFIAELIEKIVDGIRSKFFGSQNEKCISYSFSMVWFIKFQADIIYFLEWMKYDVFRTTTVIKRWWNREPSMLRNARLISPDGLMQMLFQIFKFFFKRSLLHLVVGVIVIWSFFGRNILEFVELLSNFLISKQLQVNDLLDGFQLLAIVCVFVYVFLDARHKVGGYKELRKERFKELIIFEEKFLSVLYQMEYSLANNIKFIVKNKSEILRNAASDLCGVPCKIRQGKIIEYDKQEWICNRTKAGEELFCDLDDMKTAFQKLTKLRQELDESSLANTNLRHLDGATIFNKVKHLWLLWGDDSSAPKMNFFCKGSMELWYSHCFVDEIVVVDGEKKYYSKNYARDIILQESDSLDYELQRAFIMELSLKKYIKIIERKMDKLHRFSRIGLS